MEQDDSGRATAAPGTEVQALSRPTPRRWRSRGGAASGSQPGFLEFDVHGRLAVRVAADAPTAPLLAEVLAPFAKSGLSFYDLTITGEHHTMVMPSFGEHAYRYTQEALHVRGMDMQIRMAGDEVHISGGRELLTAVLPMMDSLLVERNAAMIHGATVAYRGHGIALPAWGGVGNRSTVAKLMGLGRVSFMGHDWAFVTGDGRLLGYAKPLYIKPYHRTIYPHLFEGTRKPLVPRRLLRPLAGVARAVHPFTTRYPSLAGFTRRFTLEHRIVTPRQAFPGASIAAAAPLFAAVFLERYDGSAAILEDKGPEWMASRMIGNFNAELPPDSREVITALGATGLVPVERFFALKADVLQRALVGKPCFSLRIPVWMKADVASDVIVHYLREVFRLTGIT